MSSGRREESLFRSNPVVYGLLTQSAKYLLLEAASVQFHESYCMLPRFGRFIYMHMIPYHLIPSAILGIKLASSGMTTHGRPPHARVILSVLSIIQICFCSIYWYTRCADAGMFYRVDDENKKKKWNRYE